MRNRKLVHIIVLFLIISAVLTSYVTAESSESVILYTENLEDGGILSSMPVLDEDNRLHTFVHLRTTKEDKLIHLYTDGEKLVRSTLFSDISDVHFYTNFIFEDSLYVIFSVVNPLGTFSIYEYKWNSEYNQSRPIVTIASNILPYISYFKVVFYNGSLHVFYNRYYGDVNQFMNITHYWGLTDYQKEQFSISNPYYREGLDFVVHNDTIWYIYQLWETLYTAGDFKGNFGIGKLDNGTFYPVITKKMAGEIVGSVGKFEAEVGTDSVLNFVFFEPKKMFYGSFNGTHITNTTQNLNFQYNYYDFTIKKSDGIQQLMLVTKSSTENYVSLFLGTYNKDNLIWEFIPITSENKIVTYGYSYCFRNDTYVILYNATVSTSSLDRPVGLQYRAEEAIGLFYITNIELPTIKPYIDDGLELYNPLIDFVINNVVLLIILGIVLLVLVIIASIIWARKAHKFKAFLFNTEEVGKHSKLVLFFLNIWRFIINTASVVKTLGFTNKKRTLITLGGFIITGYLLGSAIIISQSEQSSMVKSFYKANTMLSDGTVTAKLSTTFINLQDSPADISPYYDHNAQSMLYSLISDYTISKYYTGINSAYYTFVRTQHPTVNYEHQVKLCSLPDDADSYLSAIITNGTIPVAEDEIILRGPLMRNYGLEINDTLTVILSSSSVSSEDEADYMVEVKIVGTFERLTTSEIIKISSFLGAPNDIYSLLETSTILTKNSHFFELLASSKKMNLQMKGIYQFLFDFRDFKIEERTIILKEQEDFLGRTFSFPFDGSSAIFFSNEITDFFEAFNTYYLQNMARLFIFAFPAILLSVFMIFESSELFSSSYVQEIDVLRNRGLKRRRVTGLYILIRLIEVIIATIISYTLAIVTAIPLIRINGFLSFTNTDTELRIGNLPVEMLLTAGILFTISIPRILVIITREKKVEKTPSKIAKIFKNVSWREVSFLLIGAGIFGVFYYLAFRSYLRTNAEYFPLYLNFTIIGALFTLIGGLPLLMKLLSMLWKAIGTVIWNAEKKNKFRFVFAEISKDIRYFENITLIFLLLIGILIPSMIVPYSKEQTLTEQSYFMNGADLMISNVHKYPGLSISDIEQIEGVESVSYMRLYTMYSDYNLGYHGVKILVINTTTFLATAHKPPERVTQLDWDKISTLTENTVFISKTLAQKYKKDIGDTIFLIHPDAEFDTKEDRFVHPYNHTMTITSYFDLFPVYFLSEDKEKEENMMIVSEECFKILEPVIVRRLLTSSALLIKPTDPKKSNEVAERIFKVTGGAYVSTVEGLKNSLKTPLYNIFIIEMILSLFVAAVVLVFSSFTTATKILEKRVIKHDIMKKMGINVRTIINLSVIECFIAAVIPSVALGSLFGFLVINPMLNLLSYGSEPYPLTIQFPLTLLIVGFLALPVILYISLNLNLRREFAKYTPTQLE
ncbi:MAG: ABC transporter permease [Candidatus Heimdallarchaeaceae archaeon]